MTWELLMQLGTLSAAVAAIAFGYLGWLRARNAEGQREAEDGAKAAVENATVIAKLEGMASDFAEVKSDLKEIREDTRAYREDQIRHDARIGSLEGRVAALEFKMNGGFKNEA